MAAFSQQSQAVLLQDLPPELLRKIVDMSADDITHGRKAMLGLSVTSKYIRNVTIPRLFERIRFRDGPKSSGDEILYSIRQFTQAPDLWRHVRTVSLHLNRCEEWVAYVTSTLAEPYHYLILPELINALVRMPNVTELHIGLAGEQGVRCLDGLQTAVHWCLARRELNIRSLTAAIYTLEDFRRHSEAPYIENGFLRDMPQVKAFCSEGEQLHPNVFAVDPTIASNLTQVRVYKTCSDPRNEFLQNAWIEHERFSSLSQLRLSENTPELEYLSVLGELDHFPVSRLLGQFTNLPKLRYLDITDEQMMDGSTRASGFCFLTYAASIQRGDRLSHIKHLARKNPLNEDRSELAMKTFDQCANLRRICFVRSCVGEVYLRGYPDAVADSTGYVSPEVNSADLSDIPDAWHHGVPQTGLLPFPGFTPWEGIEKFM